MRQVRRVLCQEGRLLLAAEVEALEQVGRDTAGIHLSFDLDGVDPADAPGVGTPVPGGLSLSLDVMCL